MTIQFSVPVRNAMLDAIEAQAGPSAIVKLRTGAPPANCAAADSGTVIATLNLPVDWMADAVNGVKVKSGTWEDPAVDNSGTVGHYRLYATDGVTCHEQGTVTGIGGGGDMTLDNVTLVQGQDFVITTESITAPNA